MKLIINKNSCLRFCPFAVSRGMENMSKNALSIGLQHCHQTVRKNPSVRFDDVKVQLLYPLRKYIVPILRNVKFGVKSFFECKTKCKIRAKKKPLAKLQGTIRKPLFVLYELLGGFKTLFRQILSKLLTHVSLLVGFFSIPYIRTIHYLLFGFVCIRQPIVLSNNKCSKTFHGFGEFKTIFL